MLRSTYPRQAWETSRGEYSRGGSERRKRKRRRGRGRGQERKTEGGGRWRRWQCVYALYARKTWYHRRHHRRILRPPRHSVPIYGTRRNARVRGGNLLSDIELSMDVSFFPSRSFVGSSSLAWLRIRSYIEIVSDISTLSFFPSRLWNIDATSGRRERRESRGKETEDLARREDGGRRWYENERERGEEGEKERRKREGRRDERWFALRQDRKRDSLGLVIYLKRSRAPCATTRGTEASAHRVPKSEREKESRWRWRRRWWRERSIFGRRRESGVKNTWKIIVTSGNTTVRDHHFREVYLRCTHCTHIDVGIWRNQYRAKWIDE